MEDLLLALDELDDAVAAARHLAPRLLGFLAALVLFALTVLGFLILPKVTLAAAAVLLSIVLIDRVGRRLLTDASRPTG
ncbi:MAG: hypothetical protein ABW034_13835 [Steroidobacteraceae bacterium]